MDTDPFKEYLREGEPDKQAKGYAWHTAIGLQDVDGLKTSDYLVRTAVRNIEGEITFAQVETLLDSYYAARPSPDTPSRVEEADKVSARIAALLSEQAFSFTPGEYLAIHRRLFRGIYPHAGQMRDYNITKKEWVLGGATVLYGSATELAATLEYDFSQERQFSYRGLSLEEIIAHLARFVSQLWQIHVFAEGNTRTTAVFFIKYLRALGFEATNDIFAENAWYFRNALVRANYNDLKNGVHATTEYLELFLRNLLVGEENPLQNRTLHLSGRLGASEKADIGTEKADIQVISADIHEVPLDIARKFQPKTAQQILTLREAFPGQTVFGRTQVMHVLGIKASRASELLRQLLEHGVTETVSGHGKGKYRFRISG